MMLKVIERGNGFPKPGDLLAKGDDVYRVGNDVGFITTDPLRRGGNWLLYNVERAGALWQFDESDLFQADLEDMTRE